MSINNIHEMWHHIVFLKPSLYSQHSVVLTVQAQLFPSQPICIILDQVQASSLALSFSLFLPPLNLLLAKMHPAVF